MDFKTAFGLSVVFVAVTLLDSAYGASPCSEVLKNCTMAFSSTPQNCKSQEDYAMCLQSNEYSCKVDMDMSDYDNTRMAAEAAVTNCYYGLVTSVATAKATNVVSIVFLSGFVFTFFTRS